jgi:hypothetical protein
MLVVGVRVRRLADLQMISAGRQEERRSSAVPLQSTRLETSAEKRPAGMAERELYTHAAGIQGCRRAALDLVGAEAQLQPVRTIRRQQQLAGKKRRACRQNGAYRRGQVLAGRSSQS